MAKKVATKKASKKAACTEQAPCHGCRAGHGICLND